MVARYYLKLIQIISVLCAREAHTKVKDSATNLKMDETQARGVIKYLPKKGMTPKEMALDEMVQEFKKGRVRTDDDPRSYPPKTSTTDDRVDADNRMVLDDKCLTVQ